jgi:hypothetical protein
VTLRTNVSVLLSFGVCCSRGEDIQGRTITVIVASTWRGRVGAGDLFPVVAQLA